MIIVFFYNMTAILKQYWTNKKIQDFVYGKWEYKVLGKYKLNLGCENTV